MTRVEGSEEGDGGGGEGGEAHRRSPSDGASSTTSANAEKQVVRSGLLSIVDLAGARYFLPPTILHLTSY